MTTLVRYNTAPAFLSPVFGSRVYGRPVVSRFYNSRPNVPAANVRETETSFQLALAVPGLKKEAVKITVDKHVLTVAYAPEVKADETTEKFTRHEFGVGAFERGFRLPKTVNTDQITAAYADGILTIELPKVEVNEENMVRAIAVV